MYVYTMVPRYAYALVCLSTTVCVCAYMRARARMYVYTMVPRYAYALVCLSTTVCVCAYMRARAYVCVHHGS